MCGIRPGAVGGETMTSPVTSLSGSCAEIYGDSQESKSRFGLGRGIVKIADFDISCGWKAVGPIGITSRSGITAPPGNFIMTKAIQI